MVILLPEPVNHCESKRWNDNDGANVRENHLFVRTCDVQDCCRVHLAHPIDQIVIVRRHRVSCCVQRYHDEAIEDGDYEEQDSCQSQEDKIQSVICATDHLQLIVTKMPQSLEPIGNVFDSIAPSESNFAAAISPMVLLVLVDIGVV